MYDVIIIGSGPAGLSAAVYGKRAGLNLLVLEQNPMSGGQVLNTYEVDNYLGMPGQNGFDMGTAFRAHADALGVTFCEAQAQSVFQGTDCIRVSTKKEVLETKTVILATGAQHMHLGVPGETELAGGGVSYCATCDGAFYKGRTVAVVGGGDAALEDAIYLARTSEKVYLIHRRDELRGARILQERLKGLPNVEILYSHTVRRIDGEDKVNSLMLRDEKSGRERGLPVDGVFIAVGVRPNTELLSELVECDEGGYILAGEDCAASVRGIYAAGDVRRKPLRQIVTAVADGANAAVSVERYCRGQ